MKKSVIIVVLLFLVQVVSATPSVSDISNDQLIDGLNYIISGSGFGVKTTAPPLVQKDFEDMPAGTLLGEEGYWTVQDTSPVGKEPQYSSLNPRGIHSLQSAYFYDCCNCDYSTDDRASSPELDFSTNRVYLDYWVYFNWANPNLQHQVKLNRLGAGRIPIFIYPYYVWENWVNADGSHSTYNDFRTDQSTCLDGSRDPTRNLPPSSLINNGWNHLQIQMDGGTLGHPTASYSVWLNGNVYDYETNLYYRCGNEDYYNKFLLYLWVGNCYQTSSMMETYVNYDDVYVDNSWARIEIGDNQDYMSCTHRETQIPVSWNSNSIEFEANQGAFEDAEQLYLFIVDENGAVNSQGYPIQFGAFAPSCIDIDGDDYGDGENCLGPDCNDHNINVNPGASEVCSNRIDDDCDGYIDEGCLVGSKLNIKRMSPYKINFIDWFMSLFAY